MKIPDDFARPLLDRLCFHLLSAYWLKSIFSIGVILLVAGYPSFVALLSWYSIIFLASFLWHWALLFILWDSSTSFLRRQTLLLRSNYGRAFLDIVCMQQIFCLAHHACSCPFYPISRSRFNYITLFLTP